MSEIGNIGTLHMLVHRKPRLISILQSPPKGFGEQGNKGIFFRETGEHRLKNKGNTGSFGEQGTYKIKILFWGNKAIFSRGTR